MSTDCFWANGSCNKSNWPDCGYQWLVLAPIGFFSLLWVGIGLAMLRRVGLIQFLITFDAAKVHDPLAQGIAVALSQRKSGSEKRPWLLRYLKLCAMWAEWPSFTLTPLYIAFKATNNSSIFSGLLITLCTTNECIGSGRIPNNIRVLTFTSTIYTALSVLFVVICDGTIDELYYTLPALPVVGITAWLTNNKRALLYYIPNLSILNLLHESSQQAMVVGVIASVYMDPLKIHEKDYNGIIQRLETLAKASSSQEDLLCRAYAIRTLWFCHLENFRKSSMRIAEQFLSNAVPMDLWHGKDAMSSPFCIDLCSNDDILKIFAVESPNALRPGNKRLSFSPNILSSIYTDFTYHVIRVKEKNWISKVETPKEAVSQLENLFRYSLEALSQGRANFDTVAVLEISIFLLQWYKAGYLVLTQDVFVEILTSVCLCNDQLFIVEATSCIYQASIDGTLFLDLWLKHAPYFNQFALVLAHKDETTVYQCAHVLSLVLAMAATESNINLYVFLVPDSINKIQHAFKKWQNSYRISDAIENCYQHLYGMEIRARQKQQQSRVIKLAKEEATSWLSKLKAGVAQMIAPVHNSKSSITSRISNRLSIILPPSNRPIVVKNENKMPSPSPTLLSPVEKSVSETRLSIDLKVRPPGIQEIIPTGNPEPALVQRKSSPQIYAPPLQVAGHRSSLKSTYTKRSSKLLPLPPMDMSVRETRLTNGSIKVLDLAIVPNEIMIEIHQRRHLRKRFKELLEQAYFFHHNSGESPRISVMITPTKMNLAPFNTGRSVRKSEFINVTANLADIYEKGEQFAMEDFIATAFRPELQEFFNAFIRPCLKTFVHTSSHSGKKAALMSTDLPCYWDGSTECDRSDWDSCDVGWLADVPIAVIAFAWACIGVGMLRRVKSKTKLFELDVMKIHDPLAQGIAVALCQRKSRSEQRPWLLRYLKLVGMWIEWPSYTLTPLAIAFKVAGISNVVETITMQFSLVTETLNLVFFFFSGMVVFVLRMWKPAFGELAIHHFIYPLVLDVFYIPLVSTFLRLATCPEGFEHIALPGGATCACIDRFGIFWAFGLIGFVIIYVSSLHYKMYIEPLSTTMDFRFQQGYQLVMVMARTVNPIFEMLLATMDVSIHPYKASCIALGLIACSATLLVYSYKTQPCIGSGRVPNNIRVLTYSSSIYSNLCVITYLGTGSLIGLYSSLTPLPFISLIAWKINNKRASRFHIPDLSILQLLHDSSPQANIVGTIAALYMDATKVRRRDHEGIINQLERFAQTNILSLLCRTYAIRTLWFCHVENFRKSKKFIGESNERESLSHKLWLKDRTNNERPATKGVNAEKRIKVFRIEDIRLIEEYEASNFPDAPAVTMKEKLQRTFSPNITKARIGRRSCNSVISAAYSSGPYHVIAIRDKCWISRKEEADEAVLEYQKLYNYSIEVLSLCRDMSDMLAMHEIAIFLLQWFRSRYLRPSKRIFLEILCALCATNHPKTAIDAAHSLYMASLDGTVPPYIWLQNTLCLNQFATILNNKCRVTVFKCASTLAAILDTMVKDTGICINLYVLLTPDTMSNLQKAFEKWHEIYNISRALEQVYLNVNALHIAHRRKFIKKNTPCPEHKSDIMSFIRTTGDRLRSGFINVLNKSSGSVSSQFSKRMSFLFPATAHPPELAANLTPDHRRRSVMANVAATAFMPTRRLSLAIGNNRVAPTALSVLTQQSIMMDGSKKHSDGLEVSSQSVNNMNALMRTSVQDDIAIKASVKAEDPAKNNARRSALQTTQEQQLLITAPSLKRIQSVKKVELKTRDFVFVSNDIMQEIIRRRALRNQMETELQIALSTATKPNAGPAVMDINPHAHNQRDEVRENYAKIKQLYYQAEECAMNDYIATAIDRNLNSFFESVVKPRISAPPQRHSILSFQFKR
ncbi:hypothetical protein THRCLA_08132 [Thraustotheca clavata]|uniref:Uncharacterized protein n=1 Tax=Thraustotheca clavata TaxID=74557 RepID=A0A1V9Z9Q2_9STRA|nr:hypothetical protein THRCLA_08132 [Thraustotheca clavata]